LERFDREYRARLTSFMQQQLRALWVDQPQPPAELEAPSQAVADVRPAPHNDDEDVQNVHDHQDVQNVHDHQGVQDEQPDE
jgi:hypothetical protein